MKPTPVRFGVIADVQYAEKPNAEGRSYRAAIKSLEKAAASFNSSKLDFVIQLGDFIDGSDNAVAELKKAAGVFEQIRSAKYHVLGNHDLLNMPRSLVMQLLQMPKAYYYFDMKQWRFIVLDTLDYSLQGGWAKDSQNVVAANQMLQRLALLNAENAQEYNGAVGPAQLEWFENILADADAKNMPVILFTHLPLMPQGEKHTAWNAEQVVSVLENYPSVKACISGHNHAGGYHFSNGIHYVTLEAMVNAAANEGAWGIVDLTAYKMQIHGFGALTSRVLNLHRA